MFSLIYTCFDAQQKEQQVVIDVSYDYLAIHITLKRSRRNSSVHAVSTFQRPRARLAQLRGFSMKEMGGSVGEREGKREREG